MENTNQLKFLTVNSLLNQNIYYSSDNSLLFKKIEVFNHCLKINNIDILSNLIFKEESENILFNERNLINIKKIIYDTNLIIKNNTLHSSTLKHEYFHLIDKFLNKNIYLPLKTNTTLAYSELNPQNNQLPEFNLFIEQLSSPKILELVDEQKFSDYLQNKTISNTEPDIVQYFKTYFSYQFNQLPLDNIKDYHIMNELENILGGADLVTRTKYQEKEDITKALLGYINNNLGNSQTILEENLFTLFAKAKDLGRDDYYFNSIPEKLARIYQSQFHTTNDIKYFPLGTEKKLIIRLNDIIEKELKPILSNELTQDQKIEIPLAIIQNNIKAIRNLAFQHNDNNHKNKLK